MVLGRDKPQTPRQVFSKQPVIKSGIEQESTKIGEICRLRAP
jgi:hypothetical protein